jgi:hypothetical protein
MDHLYRPIRRILIGGLLVGAIAVPRAEASPVLFQFATQLPVTGSPVDGMMLFGSLVFDDAGFNVVNAGFGNLPIFNGPQVPITYASFNIGPYAYSSHQVIGGFMLEQFLFGVALTVKPEFLPAGLSSFDLMAGYGPLAYSYTWPNPLDPLIPHMRFFAPCVSPGACFISFTTPPPSLYHVYNIPEPASWFFGLCGAATIALFRRER